MSHFNVSLIVRAKSRDSVHKPQFLKRKESRSGLNRCPAYLPSALPLGHTGSQCGHVVSCLFVGLDVNNQTRYPLPPLSTTPGLLYLDDSIVHPRRAGTNMDKFLPLWQVPKADLTERNCRDKRDHRHRQAGPKRGRSSQDLL